MRRKVTMTGMELRRMYQSGMSLRQIGETCGATPSAVRLAMIQEGIKRRPQDTSAKWNQRKDEIIFLYQDRDMSQEQIAAYYGVHPALVWKVMHRLKIATFGKGRRKGSAHHQYKDGKSSTLYRTMIPKDRCGKCGMMQRLVVHHKNGNHLDNHLENLAILCEACHNRMNKLAWWKERKSRMITGTP